MRIYGQSFDTIYRALPWHYRALIIISIAFILFIFTHLGHILFRANVVASGPAPLSFYARPLYSWTDPAIASDGKGNTVMAYTTMPVGMGAPPRTDILLATPTSGACKEWKPLSGGNGDMLAYEGTLIAPDNVTTIGLGMWRYETPALVYDPGDPERAWKLYAYKYMWTKSHSLAAARRYSMIVMRSAATPTGTWAEETVLFGATPEYPPMPYQEAVKINLSGLSPELADVTMYTRPSVIEGSGVLVMSLSAYVRDEVVPDRVVMIASQDHGKSWQYLGAPLTRKDTLALGHNALNGASLLRKGKRIYLAAVFANKVAMAAGTVIFAFDDLGKATLVRDGDGVPKIVNDISRSSERPTPVGGGYAAYSDACENAGVITGESSGITGRFHLFMTKIQPDG